MDADAIEGLILIVRQAERSIAEIISGVYETAYDNALAASNLVRGAINLLEAAAIAEDGRLSTFGAFSVAWTLDAACGLLATVKAPAEWNAAHSTWRASARRPKLRPAERGQQAASKGAPSRRGRRPEGGRRRPLAPDGAR